MLSFIPLNNSATIYRQSGSVDKWGQPTLVRYKTARCKIEYNTDLTKISGEDGVGTTMSATVVFNGLMAVTNGDYVEFTTAMGMKNKYQIKDVFFFEDYAGKILATRVVVGSGKRS